MAAPWEKTVEVLRLSDHATAPALLVEALSAPIPELRLAAAEHVASRGKPRDHIELIRHHRSIPGYAAAAIQQHALAMVTGVRQLLVEGTTEERRLTLDAIRTAESFQHLPLLVQWMMKPDVPDRAYGVDTFRTLVYRMYDLLDQGAHVSLAERSVAVASEARGTLLADLQRILNSPTAQQLPDPQPLVEAVLVLGTIDHPAVRQALWHGPTAIRQIGVDYLMRGSHPSIARRILESLHEAYPHPRIFEVLTQRNETDFVGHFLRGLPRRIAGQLFDNLRQLTYVEWVMGDLMLLELLPIDLQPAIVEFVVATGIPREAKAAVHDWMLYYGSAAGKAAASEHTGLLEETTVQGVVLGSIESQDPQMQAWAVSQLRLHSVPHAFALLIDRLDSPLPEVSAAARAELADFNTERVLVLANSLDDASGAHVGRLLLKVDPACKQKLHKELTHRLRHRRVATLHRIARLALQDEVIEDLVLLCGDGDGLVRRTAAEVLGAASDPRAATALQHLLSDDHPRVKDAAARAWKAFCARHAPPVERSSDAAALIENLTGAW